MEYQDEESVPYFPVLERENWFVESELCLYVPPFKFWNQFTISRKI
jgi:hypothetical protein